MKKESYLGFSLKFIAPFQCLAVPVEQATILVFSVGVIAFDDYLLKAWLARDGFHAPSLWSNQTRTSAIQNLPIKLNLIVNPFYRQALRLAYIVNGKI